MHTIIMTCGLCEKELNVTFTGFPPDDVYCDPCRSECRLLKERDEARRLAEEWMEAAESMAKYHGMVWGYPPAGLSQWFYEPLDRPAELPWKKEGE